MQELIEQVLDILRGIWRFRWVAFAVALGICLMGWPVVLMLPNIYEADARVFVDPSTALKPVIQGIAIVQDINSELNLVRQTLLGPDHLKRVLDATGMSKNAATPQEQTAALDSLRNRIAIITESGQASGGEGQSPSRIYTISYRDDDRERSLRVVQMLLESFVTNTLGGKRQGSLEAQRFIMGQIADYEAKLRSAEEQLADFKKRNVGMVPGQQSGDYFTQLQNEMDAVKKAQGDLGIAVTRRNALDQQLRGEAPVAAAAGMPATPGGIAQGGGDTLSRIKETQAKLDDMLLRYTDNHPDVLALQETLAQLKQRRAAEIEALRRGDAGAAAATGASANPVYQSIQLALNQANVEIAGLREQLATHQQKVTELRRMVDTMPQVEAEYARLNRDYNVTKEQYTALVERLGKARLGEEAEATGSVRFEVINPPAASFSPVFPRRSLFLAVVLAAAMAAGLGIAYLLNMIKPVFHNERMLAHLTGINVIGVVSALHSPAEIRQRRLSYIGYSLACALLLAALVVVVIVGRKFSPLLHG